MSKYKACISLLYLCLHSPLSSSSINCKLSFSHHFSMSDNYNRRPQMTPHNLALTAVSTQEFYPLLWRHEVFTCMILVSPNTFLRRSYNNKMAEGNILSSVSAIPQCLILYYRTQTISS